MEPIFKDRIDAGRRLAARLMTHTNNPDVIVLGLPRGGVPVAAEVAEALNAPLDVFVVRKLGTPGQSELAMGAIASGGTIVLDNELISHLRIHGEDIDRILHREIAELERREKEYRDDRPAIQIAGKTVILVDDGLATGSTMRAAIRALRHGHPRRIIVAVPTAAISGCEDIREEADDCICAVTPHPFFSVGQSYQEFSQTTDEEVREILGRHASRQNPATLDHQS